MEPLARERWGSCVICQHTVVDVAPERAPILARIWPVFPVLCVLLILVGALWFFSVNEFKAPDPAIVVVPDGFEVLGEGSDGGSGGTTNTYLALMPPEAMSWRTAVDVLREELRADGWIDPRHEGADLQRDDALARFKRATDWIPYNLRHLDDLQAEDRRRVVVVNLAYVDLGVGRRSLTNH